MLKIEVKFHRVFSSNDQHTIDQTQKASLVDPNIKSNTSKYTAPIEYEKRI